MRVTIRCGTSTGARITEAIGRISEARLQESERYFPPGWREGGSTNPHMVELNANFGSSPSCWNMLTRLAKARHMFHGETVARGRHEAFHTRKGNLYEVSVDETMRPTVPLMENGEPATTALKEARAHLKAVRRIDSLTRRRVSKGLA